MKLEERESGIFASQKQNKQMKEKKKSTESSSRRLSSSYAVEKHDRNERVAPLLVAKTRRSSSRPKEENDEEEDVKEKSAKETKQPEEGCFAGEEEEEDSSLTENGETTACDAKKDDRGSALRVERRSEDAVKKREEPLEIIWRELCGKKVSSAAAAVDYDSVNAQIEIMISETLEILNEGKRAKCSPLTVSIFGSLDENRFGCENSRWPGFDETESEAKFQELVKERIDAFVEKCQVDIEKENHKRRASVVKKTIIKGEQRHNHSRALKPWLGA